MRTLDKHQQVFVVFFQEEDERRRDDTVPGPSWNDAGDDSCMKKRTRWKQKHTDKAMNAMCSVSLFGVNDKADEALQSQQRTSYSSFPTIESEASM